MATINEEINEIRRRAGLNEIFGLFGPSDEERAEEHASSLDAQCEQYKEEIHKIYEIVQDFLDNLEERIDVIKEMLEEGTNPETGEVLDDNAKKKLLAEYKEGLKDYKEVEKDFEKGQVLGDRLEEMVDQFQDNKLGMLGLRHADDELTAKKVEAFAKGPWITFQRKYIKNLKKLGEMVGVNLQLEFSD